MSAEDPRTLGVVLMSYGSPASLDDVERYYTHIRGGRAPSAEQVRELQDRYRSIGGTSPLAERTAAQRDAIVAELGEGFVVVVGSKHSPPFVEDAVDDLAAAGAASVVGVVLSPHWSQEGVGRYHGRAAARCQQRGLHYDEVKRWYDGPAFVEFQASAVEAAVASLPAPVQVLFTAHSLPERALDGDGYPEELRAGAAAIVERVSSTGALRWETCWQSAGRSPEPWRGPDVGDVLRRLGTEGEVRSVVVCAHGFVVDHLEVLYDLDVVAASIAADVGLRFARTPSVDADPAVMSELAGLIAAAGR